MLKKINLYKENNQNFNGYYRNLILFRYCSSYPILKLEIAKDIFQIEYLRIRLQSMV